MVIMLILLILLSHSTQKESASCSDQMMRHVKQVVSRNTQMASHVKQMPTPFPRL